MKLTSQKQYKISMVFLKINEIDKPLARVTKNKGEDACK